MAPALLLAAAVSLPAWDTAATRNRGERVEDFMARIARIKAAIGDLTWTGGLFAYPEFREVHAHPQAHVEAALEVLAGPGTSEQDKVIVALSMQKLPLPERLRFSDKVLGLLDEGLVSQAVFEQAVFPTYDWSTALAERFDDPEVQRFLQRVLASPAVGEQRKGLVRDEYLTGNARKDVLELREAGEIK
jgi:hypothetical protein